MEKFIVKGGNSLRGEIIVSGAKNVALKAIVASCLTNDQVTIDNIPLITDFKIMVDIIKELGGVVKIQGHTAYVNAASLKGVKVSLDSAASIRTSSLLIAPLLARFGKAIIPNPGGCRIGARPIDRTIEGLKKMGVKINYDSNDGYFHAQVEELSGTIYKFDKNTHTGTETMIMAAVLAKGTTVLENAAQEPEVDELIDFLNKMGANIKRIAPRIIKIDGVLRLHGVQIEIGPDRNEIITFATFAILTGGDIFIRNVKKQFILKFLEKLEEAGGGFKEEKNGMRFFAKGKLKATDIITSSHPGFMTDWQAPWTVLMTQADGVSSINETVYENRFGYTEELKKMGARIELFNPVVKNPKEFYNFNIQDDKKEYRHAASVYGPVKLHNAVVTISDLRAGATLVLAALTAKGKSIIFGVEHLDRGYEKFDDRLRSLGADIKRIKEE